VAKPWTHAVSSAKKYGGTPNCYLKLHETMDSVKAHFPSNFGRCVFHSSYGAYVLIPMIFGPTITNCNGRQISSSQLAEDHILEDFKGKFIPTIQDWFDGCELKPWMCNGIANSIPPSYENMKKKDKSRLGIILDGNQSSNIEPEDVVMDGASQHYYSLKKKELEPAPEPEDIYQVEPRIKNLNKTYLD
jgi:hypothetical protein